MFRIGILGSDNSHALAFAKLCNIPDTEGNYLYEDVRITAIYGKDDDKKHTEEVAKEGRIEFIAEKPEDFFGKVDAVMVVFRRGSYHIPEILPFIEAGIPCWIDKPICKDISDVKLLENALKKGNGLVTGGSTIKYNYDIITTKNICENKEAFGDIVAGSMNFPGDANSEYEGLFFYGSHLVEMMLTVFGYEVKSVIAKKAEHDRISVIASYDSFNVALNYTPFNNDFYITVLGEKNSLIKKMDISIIYKLGFEKFIWMLHNGRMPLSFDKLVKPVYVLNAIDKSINEGREVTLEEMYD